MNHERRKSEGQTKETETETAGTLCAGAYGHPGLYPVRSGYLSKRHYIGENPLTQGPMEIQPFTAHFKKAQAANPLLAPLTFSTPLCKVRYQKMAAFAERCCFFCRKTASFNTRKANSKKTSVFVKKTSAFLEKIRGPPSEIWFRDQIHKRRSAKWQIRKST